MTTPPDALESTTLRDPVGELEVDVLPGAGMLITSLRHRGEELLGQRRGVQAYLDAGKTMGIPLLYPWANRLGSDEFTVGGVAVDLRGERPGLRRDPAGLAIHGLLAADAGWAAEPSADGAAISATLDFAQRPELLASFPFPHRVTYSAHLGDGTLTLRTDVDATGGVPVPVAHGLHPYLTLPGLPRTEWHVELPARDHLALDARGLPTGATEHQTAWAGRLAERTFDDAYAAIPAGADWVLSGGGRRITTTFVQGYPAAQLFAPAEDAVICFEPMAAPTNALVTGQQLRLAAPGAPDRAEVRIAVE